MNENFYQTRALELERLLTQATQQSEKWKSKYLRTREQFNDVDVALRQMQVTLPEVQQENEYLRDKVKRKKQKYHKLRDEQNVHLQQKYNEVEELKQQLASKTEEYDYLKDAFDEQNDVQDEEMQS